MTLIRELAPPSLQTFNYILTLLVLFPWMLLSSADGTFSFSATNPFFVPSTRGHFPTT